MRFSAPTIHQAGGGGETKADREIDQNREDDLGLLQGQPQDQQNDEDRHHPVQRRAVGDGGEFLVGERHRAGQAHSHALVRRQAQFGDRRPDRLGRLSPGLEIAIIEHGLDVDEPPQIRLFRRAPGNQAPPRKGRMLALLDPLPGRRRSRTTAGLMSSSVVFLSRTPSSDCEMAPRTPRSVGSAASVPKKGSALISSSMLRCTSATLRNRIPLRAKNSPPSGRVDGADHVLPVGQRADQRVRRLVGRFRRRPVDDGDHEVSPLGKELIELFLLLAPGQRARQQLARVGVDGDMARDVDAGEDGGDQEGGNDDPRMAGRQANDPHDRSDDWGAVVFDHGTGVKGMVRAERQWGMLRCETRRIVSGT